MPAPRHSPSSTSDPRAMLTNIALASAGGYADAASYLLAGSFTGHLTGNTVLSAIALGTGDWHKLFLPVLAVAMFFTGTATGVWMERLRGEKLKPLMAALPLELVLIGCAAASGTLHLADARVMIVVCLCLALGIQNGVFRKTDGVSVHATYVTGDVTSLVASLLSPNSPKGPGSAAGNSRPVQEEAPKILGSTWLSFSGGALVSALMVHRFGPPALWLLELPIILAVFSSRQSPA